MNRIVAYHLTEYEYNLIIPAIQNGKFTDSFIVGDITDENLILLDNNKIIYTIIPVQDKHSPTKEDLEKESGLVYPAIFYLNINSPFLYLNEFNELGISIKEYLGNEKYEIELSKDVREQLRAMDFVQKLIIKFD